MNHQQQNKNIEPLWSLVDDFGSSDLPTVNRIWLLDNTSLTDRLTSNYDQEFSVRVLDQRWEAPLPSESRLLDISTGEQALIRRVTLRLGEIPVVFARTIIPASTLDGSLNHLTTLGNVSLGAILFDTPGMVRSPFEIALIPGDHTYLPRELFQVDPIWGRRSCFSLHSKRLIVSELFLSGFVPWKKCGHIGPDDFAVSHELNSVACSQE